MEQIKPYDQAMKYLSAYEKGDPIVSDFEYDTFIKKHKL